MSTFKEIQGQNIRSLSSDPSPISNGDIWYNSTSQTLKGVVGIGAWSSSPALGTARYGLMGGLGSSTAALAIGGAPAMTTVESFNGSSWTAVTAYPISAISIGAAGTQTAGIAFAGYGPGTTYSTVANTYNGTSWTSIPALNNGRYLLGSVGTQTAALAFSGGISGGRSADSEEWNGSTWTEGNNMINSRESLGAAGTQTAALGFGGNAPGVTADSEEYDGTSWSEGNNIPTATSGIRGSGIQTAALGMGGNPTTTATIDYNGTSWSANPATLAVARYSSGSTGAPGGGTSALVYGGHPTPVSSATAEVYALAATTKTFTTS